MGIVVERQLHCYRVLVQEEAWKRDHLTAQACQDLEDLISFGIFLYDQLVEADEDVRAEALSSPRSQGSESQGDDLLARVRWCFEQWVAHGDRVLSAIDWFQDQGYSVDRAPEFKKRYDEARWSLKPASEALDSRRVVALRDAALDEHRAGRAKTISRLGD